MDRLEAMTILLEAVDAGSLSAAGRRLHIPLATVSRRVSELERYLKNQLLIRGSRKLVLTDAGRDYIASCRRILEELSETERIASGEYQAPQGELVISAPVSFSRTHILPILVDFLSAYPNIKMQLSQTDRPVNLLEENVDLAVRLGSLPESSLTATRVGLVRRVLCASPQYLKTRGTPKVPDDLLSHNCIASEATHSRDWSFRKAGADYAVAISHRLTVTTVETAIDAALAHLGIAHLMSYHADAYVANGQLRVVLNEFEPPLRPLSLIYPSQRQVPQKLRAFLDFATPRLRETLNFKADDRVDVR
jgi:DNA-binding transcriptional LysR family regulator